MTTVAAPATGVVIAESADVEMHGLLAEFTTPGELYHAAEKVRDAGYTQWDCHTPYPVHGLDKAMGIRMTKLPILVFCCGLTGCLVGLALQWYTNASEMQLYLPMEVRGYPYMISGKPMWSLPANIPVIFELTILLSAFGAVFGMLGMNKLPRLYNPLFSVKRFARATSDRFFIFIQSDDSNFDMDSTRSLLTGAGATAVEVVED